MRHAEPGSKKAHERLKVLYEIGKHLASFESVELTFPKILMCASDTFPLLTVVLIEHWQEKPNTVVWHSSAVVQDQVALAISRGREAYAYMSGASSALWNEIHDNHALRKEFLQIARTRHLGKGKRKNYIVLPLLIDNLPPLGALQLESGAELDETDLEFVCALVDLVSVALDRYYRTKREHDLQDKLQHKVENLEKERELRELFVSLLTHDLRTPLSVILGASEFILRKPADPAAVQRYAEKIVSHVNRVGLMISNLLDANRIHSGERLPLKFETLDLCSLVKETASELSTFHGERFVADCEGRVEVCCDPGGVRRMIENLCNNAVKYGASDGLITLGVKDLGDQTTIFVHNTGVSIPPEDQKYLFDHFRRTPSAQQGIHKGWGIGLTLVKGVAEAHGGLVTVESSPANGTVFTVSLPKNLQGDKSLRST